MLASECGSSFAHLSNSSLIGVEGWDASLLLCNGTFTGREVASRKSVTRFLWIMSECRGRNSGREEDKDDLLELSRVDEIEIEEETFKEDVKELFELLI